MHRSTKMSTHRFSGAIHKTYEVTTNAKEEDEHDMQQLYLVHVNTFLDRRYVARHTAEHSSLTHANREHHRRSPSAACALVRMTAAECVSYSQFQQLKRSSRLRLFSVYRLERHCCRSCYGCWVSSVAVCRLSLKVCDSLSVAACSATCHDVREPRFDLELEQRGTWLGRASMFRPTPT